MKKFIYIFIVIPLFINAQHCNDGTESGVNASNVSGPKVDGEVNLNPVAFNSKTKGSPYAFSDWSFGKIVTADNKISNYTKIQIDLEKNKVMVYSDGSKFPTSIPLTNITSINVQDKNKKRNFKFFQGSDFIDSSNGGLFEICSSDNNYLIKHTQKYIYTSENSSNTSQKKSIYKKHTDYYIKDNNGKYVKTKLTKKNILKLMKDKEKEVKNYVSKNKLTYKEKDVPKILKYYHSLS